MHKLSHFRVVFQLYIQLVGGECHAGFGSIWSPNCLTGDHIQLFYNHPSSSAEAPTSFGDVEDLYNHNSLIISEVFQVATTAEKNCLAHHLHMFRIWFDRFRRPSSGKPSSSLQCWILKDFRAERLSNIWFDKDWRSLRFLISKCSRSVWFCNNPSGRSIRLGINSIRTNS